MSKIKISFDDLHNSAVDAEIKRQNMVKQTAHHQASIQQRGIGAPISTKPSFWRNPFVYLSLFGLAAGIMAWGAGECVQRVSSPKMWTAEILELGTENKWPAEKIIQILENSEINPYAKEAPTITIVNHLKEKNHDSPSNYLKILSNELKKLNKLYWVLIGMLIGAGIAVAEPVINQNKRTMQVNALLGTACGALSGFLLSLFINKLYTALGGGGDFCFRQVLARSVGWGVLGLGVGISPGIALKSRTKCILGCVGGGLGGLLGGVLFDPIFQMTNQDILSRFVNIVFMATGAGFFTALLENVAKKGWFRVKAGLLAGKQFIFYVNPTRIGSSPKNEIYLFKDPTVQQFHASVEIKGSTFRLVSQQGATVIVNGQPIRSCMLKNQDLVQIGNTVFQFESKDIS